MEKLLEILKKYKGEKIVLSLDAESDGLWGSAFAISSSIYTENGERVCSVVWNIEEYVPEDKWTLDNVIPNIPKNYDNDGITFRFNFSTREEMLVSFADLWKYINSISKVRTIWHMGHIVESRLFLDLREKNLIGVFDAPYTPVEISTLLQMKGFRPDSVDEYLAKEMSDVKISGSTHDPLYDTLVAAQVYFHLLKR